MLLDFSLLCERLKSFSLSPMEYFILRTLTVATVDRSKLSNIFGSQLSTLQNSLHELMFRMIKLSRLKSSASAANFMANLIAQVYEVRAISLTLLSTLRRSFPRDIIQAAPYQKILTDIINPEVVDLLVTMSSRPHNVSHQKLNITTPSSFSNSPTMNRSLHGDDCKSGYSHHFNASHPIQTQSLSFSSKLPLTMTKSLEDMLRFPGMRDDSNIMNRPLAIDWADGLHLTPLFNKDVVVQFFPELSDSPIV